MKVIETHKPGVVNDCIVVAAVDDPGVGGAHHQYRISGVQGPLDHHPIPTIDLRFQNGAVDEVGANGITNESLLAIVIDRLQGFQSGPFKCRENALALTKLEEAMHWLHHRTRERSARGVEGVLKP
jgi:hypothetical protein